MTAVSLRCWTSPEYRQQSANMFRFGQSGSQPVLVECYRISPVFHFDLVKQTSRSDCVLGGCSMRPSAVKGITKQDIYSECAREKAMLVSRRRIKINCMVTKSSICSVQQSYKVSGSIQKRFRKGVYLTYRIRTQKFRISS